MKTVSHIVSKLLEVRAVFSGWLEGRWLARLTGYESY